jgi:hypothetical protein
VEKLGVSIEWEIDGAEGADSVCGSENYTDANGG